MIRTSLLSLTIWLAVWVSVKAQTYTEDIAPIIYNNCTSCHRPGNIAPFNLTGYEEVKAYSNSIKFSVQNREMPPWPPDPTYSRFQHERNLSNTEIETIVSWIDNGMPLGDPSKEPAKPKFDEIEDLGKPDLILKMQNAYLHKGTGKDMYRIMVVPTGLKEDQRIKAIAVIPGNREIVHHIITAVDTTKEGRKMDAADREEGYEQYGGFGFQPAINNFHNWVPGAGYMTTYPEGMGKTLFKGSDLLMQMHYAPTNSDALDQSMVYIYFADKPTERTITTQAVINPLLLGEEFLIPANTVKTFKADLTIPRDISVIGVAPHAHNLGKSFEVYAIPPRSSDTIKLIRINRWDFHWQGQYNFNQLVKIPRGSKLYCKAVYDNTEANHHNPNSPPKDVRWGESTTEEMLLVYFSYVPYKAGDENIELVTATEDVQKEAPRMSIFPNPSQDMVQIEISEEPLNVILVDMLGQQLNVPTWQVLPRGSVFVLENSLASLSNGLYEVKVLTSKGYVSRKLLIVK
ncbi:MAG: T9SS C-terminal target domain-containing protein [Cytophagales bacterium]|nr:MAG: T9SS C-terminal target domain-containing protein [Cytophagales bacterium]TAF61211.1 MAG: T9SS C-terminal target domain-containing protein [Cytophagales bacterium]